MDYENDEKFVMEAVKNIYALLPRKPVKEKQIRKMIKEYGLINTMNFVNGMALIMQTCELLDKLSERSG